MNKNIVVASVALLLDEEEQTRKKRRTQTIGQGPGCYAEKLTVRSIQYSKNQNNRIVMDSKVILEWTLIILKNWFIF